MNDSPYPTIFCGDLNDTPNSNTYFTIRGEMQDQELCDGFRDPVYGLPVYSLYGQHLKPSSEMLDGVDVVVFDIQDVGSRYVTFIYLFVCLGQGKGVGA
jgi:uncharacterized protein YbbC (DUF1343 family)